MSVLNKIFDELAEIYIVNNVTKKHYEARNKYSNGEMTVPDDTAFDNSIADYYNSHFRHSIAEGVDLPRSVAAGKAKKEIERKFKSKGWDILNAYFDGKEGTNGGMFGIYDIIANAFIDDAIELHVRDVIDKYVQPSNYDEKVEIIKEIFQWIGPGVKNIDYDHPERYAHNYKELIKIIVEFIKRRDDSFRRM